MKLSIVVPMLNELHQLPDLLKHLERFAAQNCEVVIVDGGSQDGSVAFAQAMGFRVLCSPPGRARQMNVGASVCSGDVLLFLHADTRLPPDAVELVKRALSDRKHYWGRFDVTIDGRSPVLQLVALMMNWRSCLTGIATGDQAIFTMSHAFTSAGGFPEQPLMEDIELSERLRKITPPACIKTPALTSGRRWDERGVWRTIVLMWWLRLAYWLGTPADSIAKKYR